MSSFNVFVGMVLCQIVLFGLRQLIRDSMSVGVVGERKIVSSVVCPE